MVGPLFQPTFIIDASGANVTQSGAGAPIYDWNSTVARVISFPTFDRTSGMARLLVDASIVSGNYSAPTVLYNYSGLPLTVASGSQHFFAQNYIGLITPSPVYGFDSFDVGANISQYLSGNTNTVSGQYVRLQVTRAISGDPYNRLLVGISGQPVQISGQSMLISGQTVYLVSGFNSVVQRVPTSVNPVKWLTVPSNSGGVVLNANWEIITVTVRYNPGQSGFIHVGGSDGPPHATKGLVLQPGDFLTLNVNNLNKIMVYATQSGDKVSMVSVV